MRECQPDEPTLREFCNIGYPRNRCSRFPNDAGPDAVRFSALSERNGTLEIYYIVEKDRSPLQHGRLDYLMEEHRLAQQDGGDLIRKQAQAYAESYLRRKLQPQDDALNPHRR
jgi:hypothetical protein